MSNSIKTIIILILLIILAVLIWAGLYWYQKQIEEKNYAACIAWCNFMRQEDRCFESCRINPDFIKYIKYPR